MSPEPVSICALQTAGSGWWRTEAWQQLRTILDHSQQPKKLCVWRSVVRQPSREIRSKTGAGMSTTVAGKSLVRILLHHHTRDGCDPDPAHCAGQHLHAEPDGLEDPSPPDARSTPTPLVAIPARSSIYMATSITSPMYTIMTEMVWMIYSQTTISSKT